VRIVTLDRGSGPEIFRICVKLTGGGNVADNFWRDGNMVAPVDPESGKMGPALTALGINGVYVDAHPDTAKQITGVALPHWEEARQLALGAAGITPGALLLGFDVALSSRGPMLIEANYAPDLVMLQVSKRAGVVDKAMAEAMAYKKQIAADERAVLKSYLQSEHAKYKKDMSDALTKKAA
jgi:Sugar-transfer associated ATP-grasp